MKLFPTLVQEIKNGELIVASKVVPWFQSHHTAIGLVIGVPIGFLLKWLI